MASSNFPNRPFGLREATWVNYQEVGNNRTNFHGELWIDRYNSGYNTFSGATSSFTFFLNGSQVAGWNFTYNFANYNNLLLAAVDVWVGHNADGTKTVAIDGYANVDVMGYTEVHAASGLPTIPRASLIQFTTPDLHSLIAGQISNVNTNRASSSFTHDIDYIWPGLPQTRVWTGLATTGSWTPPMSFLNTIPNSATEVGMMRTHTYNGGSLIGYTDSPFRVTAPASVVPTWTSATWTDSVTAVTTVLGSGVFLQNLSKPVGTIVGAAGVYGSTISSYKQTVGTEVLTAATSNFTKVFATAGSAIPLTQEITDSRGRKKTLTTNVNVLPYAKPVLSTVSMIRSDPSGVADPAGTNMKVSVTGAVQSVINSTERNRLTLQIYTKLRSSSTWVLQGTPVNDSTTLALANTSYILTGPFDVASAYDVRVDLVDKFSTTSSQKALPTGEIFQHWGMGLGVGKYWEKGMVDVNGDVYASGGLLSLGKRVTNLNTQALHEGRYHVNGATNSPPPGPNGVSYALGVVDVETWYEVQGATVYHYIRQRFRFANSGTGNATRRSLDLSFRRGHAFSRISFDGGATWGSWGTEDHQSVSASTVGGSPTYNNVGNYWELNTGQNFVYMDGVFKTDVTCHRIDYYYRTGDSNGNAFRLRTNNAYSADDRYNYQQNYVSGTGSGDASVQYTNQTRAGLAAAPNDVHWGHIMLYNATQIGKVKTWTHQEGGSGPSMVVGNGHMSGTGVDNTVWDGFMLQTSTVMNNFTHGWVRITAMF